MGNAFDVNKSVALSHVRTTQLKGWFLGKARMLVIILSGTMLMMGTVMLMGNLHFALTVAFLVSLIAVSPIAVVAGLLALVIEGGTVFASNLLREALETKRLELAALQKVAAKYTAAEVANRKRQINARLALPIALMFVCISFSTMGAEIFWQNVMVGQSVMFHVIGAVLGLVCSTLLVCFELKEDMVERIVERSISSSALIGIALDNSAKAQIYNQVFASQHEYIASPEVADSIAAANQRRLHGVLATTVSIGGVTVTGEQLRREIARTREERSAADAFLTSKDENVLNLPAAGGTSADVVSIKRKGKNRVAAERLVAKYGVDRIAEDLDKYASEVKMDPRTLQRHLTELQA